MQQFQPLVSIVIPVYNGANYLAEAISSALQQTYPNIEVIVVNDGSKDGGATEKTAKSFGDRIRYISQKNGGVASALNTGFENAAGEYVSWLSHDDLYYPDKIASQVDELAKMPNRDNVILYSDFSVFSISPSDCTEFRVNPPTPEVFRYWVTHASGIHGCTLLIPRKTVLEIGGFNTKLRQTQDYDMWFRLGSICRFVHMPKLFVKARQHVDQHSKKKLREGFREGNLTLSRNIRELTRFELEKGAGVSLSEAYLIMVAIQIRRGYNWAALEAFKLSIASLSIFNRRDVKAWLSQLRESYRACRL